MSRRLPRSGSARSVLWRGVLGLQGGENGEEALQLHLEALELRGRLPQSRLLAQDLQLECRPNCGGRVEIAKGALQAMSALAQGDCVPVGDGLADAVHARRDVAPDALRKSVQELRVVA